MSAQEPASSASLDDIDRMADDQLMELQRATQAARERVDQGVRLLEWRRLGGQDGTEPVGDQASMPQIPPDEEPIDPVQPIDPIDPVAPIPAIDRAQAEGPSLPLTSGEPDFGDIAATIATDEDWKF